jgi:hypothetical protein
LSINTYYIQTGTYTHREREINLERGGCLIPEKERRKEEEDDTETEERNQKCYSWRLL